MLYGTHTLERMFPACALRASYLILLSSSLPSFVNLAGWFNLYKFPYKR